MSVGSRERTHLVVLVSLESVSSGDVMSRRNGDRARFQKNRKRKLSQRLRYRIALAKLITPEGAVAPDANAAPDAASR